MAKKPGNLAAMRKRASKAAAASSAPATPAAAVATSGGGAPAAPKKRTSIPQFFREVRAEARKITWPTRQETWITSVMVFIMVFITAVFFFFVDWALGTGVSLVLKLANS